MFILNSILTALFTACGLSVAAFLCREWLIARLRASIKFEYDQKLLDIEHQKEIKQKGEVVAELLAEWIKPNKSASDYRKLNELSFQAFIWLPQDLAKDLSNTLAHENESKPVRDIVKCVRTHLQGKDDELKSRDVIVFRTQDIKPSFNGSIVTGEAHISPKPYK